MTISQRLFIFAAAIAAIIVLGIIKAPARTLTLMPPTKYDGCKPRCKLTITRHRGLVNCGGVMAAACTYMRGKVCTIALPTDLESYVIRDTLKHERAHACGWPASHPGGRWSK